MRTMKDQSISDADGGDGQPLLPVQAAAPPPERRAKYFWILLGPAACVAMRLLVVVDGKPMARDVLAALAWIFIWWLTNAVPMPITSLAPLFLFPLLGIATAEEVAKSYMDDIISLVLGTFILALAVEHYNIHRRLALNVSFHLRAPPHLIAGEI